MVQVTLMGFIPSDRNTLRHTLQGASGYKILRLVYKCFLRESNSNP